MANICTVRTIIACAGVHAAVWLLKNKPLPHEPKSDIRYVLKYRDGTMVSIGYLGNFVVCRHCGELYEESEG